MKYCQVSREEYGGEHYLKVFIPLDAEYHLTDALEDALDVLLGHTPRAITNDQIREVLEKVLENY